MKHQNEKSKPAPVTLVRVYGQPKRTIVVNMTENADGTYDYEEIELPVNVWGRDAIIAAIVRAHYSEDKMESIINNHLDSPETEEHKKEWTEMQEWRRKAKTWADEILSKDSEGTGGLGGN